MNVVLLMAPEGTVTKEPLVIINYYGAATTGQSPVGCFSLVDTTNLRPDTRGTRYVK